MKPQSKIDESKQASLGSRIGRPYGDFYDTESLRIMKRNGFFGVTLPIMYYNGDTDAATVENFNSPFFIANRSYRVIAVTERHETASAAGKTFQIQKLHSGVAPGSGINILTVGFNLNATANTNQSGSIVQTSTSGVLDRVLVTGDALCGVLSANDASLHGVCVSVLLRAI